MVSPSHRCYGQTGILTVTSSITCSAKINIPLAVMDNQAIGQPRVVAVPPTDGQESEKEGSKDVRHTIAGKCI